MCPFPAGEVVELQFSKTISKQWPASSFSRDCVLTWMFLHFFSPLCVCVIFSSTLTEGSVGGQLFRRRTVQFELLHISVPSHLSHPSFSWLVHVVLELAAFQSWQFQTTIFGCTRDTECSTLTFSYLLNRGIIRTFFIECACSPQVCVRFLRVHSFWL